MSALADVPSRMTVAEFLSWDAPPGTRWQLVDGEPRSMAPASRTHGAIQNELGRLIANHLSERSIPCSVVANPGVVPRVQSQRNFRIPDLAVTCTRYESEEHALSEPVVVIEILSPSNQAETWTNVWAYASVPSVQEILVVKSTEAGALMIRRDHDGSWPNEPERVDAGGISLRSIGFSAPLAAVYRTTRLAMR